MSDPPAYKSIEAFLAEAPPGTESSFVLHGDPAPGAGIPRGRLVSPCDVCEAEQRFITDDSIYVCEPSAERWTDRDLVYRCPNCDSHERRIAILTRFSVQHPIKFGEGQRTLTTIHVRKMGEWPPFGSQAKFPARLLRLVGKEHADLLIKGRRAENQGLGIGAFAYYRRAIELSWEAFVGELLRSAAELGLKGDVIDRLQAARDEHQFSTAVKSLEESMPERLMIGGSNPFSALYKAASEGLHALSDEECLRKAIGLRRVLVALVERLAEVRRDAEELREAMKALQGGE